MHGQVAGAAHWLLPLDRGQGRLARQNNPGSPGRLRPLDQGHGCLARQYTTRPPGGRGLSTRDRGAWRGNIIICEAVAS